MSKHGKRYFNALKKAPKKEVTLEEAVKFVKDNAGAKFDETVDVYFHLGKELTKGDTAVRGTVKLPNSPAATTPKRRARPVPTTSASQTSSRRSRRKAGATSTSRSRPSRR